MQDAIVSFLDTTRDYLLHADQPDARRATEPGAVRQEVKEMKALDERLKSLLARRMKDAVINPPHRLFARELLARGLTANEVWQLVMHDPTFVRVPESFRIAVANAAREMAGQQLLAAPGRRQASERKTSV